MTTADWNNLLYDFLKFLLLFLQQEESYFKNNFTAALIPSCLSAFFKERMLYMIHDGHIHTPYCPHGSTDSLQSYVEEAVRNGFQRLTFTEHAPLPEGFQDPVPDQDSAMRKKDLPYYIGEIQKLKQFYRKDIEILTGLEIDFIEGYEAQTADFLREIGPELDDAVLSVHFLRSGSGYTCLDFDEHAFRHLKEYFGSLENLYSDYYRTVRKSITSDLGAYKPKRIGHITLVRKFQKLFPRTFDDTKMIRDVLGTAAAEGCSLDINTAGLRKRHCREIYPPLPFVKEAASRGIPLTFGSDAHQSGDVGADYEQISEYVEKHRFPE
jgi:histidinol-phosphatase (PHP family)